MSSNKLQMNQPYKILTDIWGVITSWEFKANLNTYIDDNIEMFLTQNWKEYGIKAFVLRLQEVNESDAKECTDLPPIETTNEDNSEAVIKSIVKNIKWREVHKLKTFAKESKQLYNSIMSDGYRNKTLRAHAFDDVLPAFQSWTAEDLGIKIYTFASGSSDKQRLFLSSCICGHLNDYIINGINSFQSYKRNSSKFHQIFSALLERVPQNILYLTDSPKKAKAALESGMRAVVVLRQGNKVYSDQELNGLQTVTSLNDFQFIPSN